MRIFLCTQHFSQTTTAPFYTHPRLPANMPAFRKPVCAVCMIASEPTPATKALFAAVDVVAEVEEAAAERPETAALEMLAIVATEVANAMEGSPDQ